MPSSSRSHRIRWDCEFCYGQGLAGKRRGVVGLKYVKVVKGGDSTLLRFSGAHSRKLHSALGNMLAGPIEVAREI